MLTAAAFLLFYTVGCLLALVRHPVYGLVTYVALIYVHPPAQWWGQNIPSLRWSLIAAAVTLIALFIHKSDPQEPRLFQFGLMKGLVFFLGWLGLQYFWALDKSMHIELLLLMAKYTLLIGLIYKCVQSVSHLRIVVRAHAAGCFYLGTVVVTEYLGGRFDGFEGPGISEANAAALLLVSGILATFVLFLSGRILEKFAAVGMMPFTLNALVATISRSGFLALAVAGVIFNLLVPKKGALNVRLFSLAGLALFIALSNPVYWERIGTILFAGEEVEGVDTGSKRLVLIQAQLQMFEKHPLGCGHRCTAVLSPHYLGDANLTGVEGNRARSSHNTFMTLLVEQGIPGALLYVVLLVWIIRSSLRLRKRSRDRNDFAAYAYAATVSILGAITVGDLFVDYLKFEARIWFLALLMVLIRMEAIDFAPRPEPQKTIAGPARLGKASIR